MGNLQKENPGTQSMDARDLDKKQHEEIEKSHNKFVQNTKKIAIASGRSALETEQLVNKPHDHNISQINQNTKSNQSKSNNGRKSISKRTSSYQ